MSESTATARLDFDISGFTAGEKALIESMSRMMARDKAFKQEIEKAPRQLGFAKGVLESEGKVKRNLTGLFKDLMLARTGTDALQASVVRLGETFKMGLGGAIGLTAIGAIIAYARNAGNQIDQLQTKLDELGRPAGSVGGLSIGDLQKHLADAQALQKQNAPSGTYLGTLGQSISGLVGTGYSNWKKLSEWGVSTADDALSRVAEGRWGDAWDALGNPKQGLDQVEFGTVDDAINGRNKRAAELQKIITRDRSRIAEKYRMTDVAPDAEEMGGSVESAVKMRIDAAFREKIEKFGKVGGADENLPLADALREALAQALEKVSRQFIDRSITSDESSDLISLKEGRNGLVDSPRARAGVALRAAQRRFDASLNRSGEENAEALLGLRSAKADYEDALLAENTDPRTGRMRSASSRVVEAAERRRFNRNQDRALADLKRTGGLLNVQRDGSGRIVSGIDPETGKRRAPTDLERERMAEQGATDATARRDSASAAERLSDEMFGRLGSTAKKAERGSDKGGKSKAERAANAKDQASENSASASLSGGLNALSESIKKIESVVTSWDR